MNKVILKKKKKMLRTLISRNTENKPVTVLRVGARVENLRPGLIFSRVLHPCLIF